jgi:hypothetical protein
MSIGTFSPAGPLTIEEREEKMIEYLYLDKIIREERQELLETAKGYLRAIPSDAPNDPRDMKRWATPEWSGGAGRNVVRYSWDPTANGTTLDRVSGLALFHEDTSLWPQWREDADENAVEQWVSLIALAPDAKRAEQSYRETRAALSQLQNIGSYNCSDTRELRGWYATVNTGRRHETGWIVSGRGKTLHLQPDPLAEARGFEDRAAERACYLAAEHVGTTGVDGIPKERITFNMKSAHISLALPPELATMRRVSVEHSLRVALSEWERAVRITEEWKAWAEKTQEARAKKASIQSFEESLPEGDLAEIAAHPENVMRQLHWNPGSKEVWKLAIKHWGNDLKQMIVEEWIESEHAGLGLTEAETLSLKAEPEYGGRRVQETLRCILTAERIKDMESGEF